MTQNLLVKKKPKAYKIFKKKNCVLKNKIERHFSNVPKKKPRGRIV